VGAPGEVYETPTSAFVYDFLGSACRLPGEVAAGRLKLPGWEAAAPAGAGDGAVEVFFRPNEVAFAPAKGAGVPVSVKQVTRRGPALFIEGVAADRLLALEARVDELPAGEAAGGLIRIRPLNPSVYPRA
jgi:sulfate transport system ATP-binding protein